MYLTHTRYWEGFSDFQDGTKLAALVQVLQKRKLRHNKKPVNQHQELENITIALDAITEDGIKLVNIGRNIFSLLYFIYYAAIICFLGI